MMGSHERPVRCGYLQVVWVVVGGRLRSMGDVHCSHTRRSLYYGYFRVLELADTAMRVGELQ